MSTLAETISEAMIRLGPAVQDSLREITAELYGLNLGEEDRLAALATALATVASTHHSRHKPVYLEAVRAWSLEISVELAPRRCGSFASPAKARSRKAPRSWLPDSTVCWTAWRRARPIFRTGW